MLGFLFRVAFGTVKLGVKYIVVPAVLSVAVTLVAEALAQSIRESTPAPAANSEHAPRARRPRKVAAVGA